MARQSMRDKQKRAIVEALGHWDAHLLATAARAFADSMNAVDALKPDPEMRSNANRLRTLALLLHEANLARDFLDENEGRIVT